MRHVPVLPTEVIDGLNLSVGKTIVDCTLGDGGHAEMILSHIAPDGRLVGIDADPESLLRAKQFLRAHEDQTILVRGNFATLSAVLAENKIGPVDGILIDLGWSSPQFEERKRGFSFQLPDESLDMRFDTRLECPHVATDPPMGFDGKPIYGRCTAGELVNTKSEKELETIFRTLGEEKQSKAIAKAIVEKRDVFAIETVGDLVDIILEVYRAKLKTDKEVPWIGGIHPATRVFQALRIAVNDELEVLKTVLPQAVDALAPGGRLAVISFHSLEDRIVKHFYKDQKGKTLNIITKKPVVASEEEGNNNPRARSAKLRIAEKL